MKLIIISPDDKEMILVQPSADDDVQSVVRSYCQQYADGKAVKPEQVRLTYRMVTLQSNLAVKDVFGTSNGKFRVLAEHHALPRPVQPQGTRPRAANFMMAAMSPPVLSVSHVGDRTGLTPEPTPAPSMAPSLTPSVAPTPGSATPQTNPVPLNFMPMFRTTSVTPDAAAEGAPAVSVTLTSMNGQPINPEQLAGMRLVPHQIQVTTQQGQPGQPRQPGAPGPAPGQPVRMWRMPPPMVPGMHVNGNGQHVMAFGMAMQHHSNPVSPQPQPQSPPPQPARAPAPAPAPAPAQASSSPAFIGSSSPVAQSPGPRSPAAPFSGHVSVPMSQLVELRTLCAGLHDAVSELATLVPAPTPALGQAHALVSRTDSILTRLIAGEETTPDQHSEMLHRLAELQAEQTRIISSLCNTQSHDN